MLVWSVVVLLVQLITITMLAELNRRVAEGQQASGVFLGVLALVAGLINTASLFF